MLRFAVDVVKMRQTVKRRGRRMEKQPEYEFA
jgi:hypothetical protein